MLRRVVLRCPICRKPTPQEGEQKTHPFCSSRCKQIDLGNWLGEKYRISRPLTVDDLGSEDLESLPYFVSGSESGEIN